MCSEVTALQCTSLPRRGYAWARYCTWSNGMRVLPRRGYAWARYCTWSNGMCYLAALARGRGTVLGRMECYLAAATRGRGTVLGRMECVYVCKAQMTLRLHNSASTALTDTKLH